MYDFINGPPNGPVLFRWLASVVVVCNAAGDWAGWPPGAWTVGVLAVRRVGIKQPTLHGGPVWLHPIRATPCLIWFDHEVHFSSHTLNCDIQSSSSYCIKSNTVQLLLLSEFPESFHVLWPGSKTCRTCAAGVFFTGKISVRCSQTAWQHWRQSCNKTKISKITEKIYRSLFYHCKNRTELLLWLHTQMWLNLSCNNSQ